MITLYGVEGCGPYEVAKLYLNGRGVPHTFVDLSGDGERRAALAERLGKLTSGVILEDGEHLEVMRGVSVGSLNRWLEGYRERANRVV